MPKTHDYKQLVALICHIVDTLRQTKKEQPLSVRYFIPMAFYVHLVDNMIRLKWLQGCINPEAPGVIGEHYPPYITINSFMVHPSPDASMDWGSMVF